MPNAPRRACRLCACAGTARDAVLCSARPRGLPGLGTLAFKSRCPWPTGRLAWTRRCPCTLPPKRCRPGQRNDVPRASARPHYETVGCRQQPRLGRVVSTPTAMWRKQRHFHSHPIAGATPGTWHPPTICKSRRQRGALPERSGVVGLEGEGGGQPCKEDGSRSVGQGGVSLASTCPPAPSRAPETTCCCPLPFCRLWAA